MKTLESHVLRKRARVVRWGAGGKGLLAQYLACGLPNWVILTHSMQDAHKIKEMAKHFLQRNGRLTLSEEKTLITNVTKDHLTFLGLETRVRPSRKGKGLV